MYEQEDGTAAICKHPALFSIRIPLTSLGKPLDRHRASKYMLQDSDREMS